MLLRQKRPVALIDAFFEERAYTTLDGRADPRAAEMREREDEVARSIDEARRPETRIRRLEQAVSRLKA